MNIHPEQGIEPGIFDDREVRTPDFYDQAYDEVDQFTKAVRKRKRGIGFLGILMMQRICSSVATGRATASRMLDNCRAGLDLEQVDDPDLLEAMDGIEAREYNSLMDNEAMHLERVLEILDGRKDPKRECCITLCRRTEMAGFGLHCFFPVLRHGAFDRRIDQRNSYE